MMDTDIPNKRILVVFDSLREDVYRDANTSKLDSIVGPHLKAYSPASYTVPSFVAIVGNNEMPKPIGDITNRFFKPELNYPRMLRSSGVELHFITDNPFLHSVNDQVYGIARHFDTYTVLDRDFNSGRRILDIASSIDTRDRYYLILWFGETHQPYRFGNTISRGYKKNAKNMKLYNEGEKSLTGEFLRYLKERQKKACEWLSENVGNFLEKHRDADIIITSDHGESFGEMHRFGHGVSIHQTQFLVPFAYKKSSR
jgi:hypothetical protein